MLYVLGRENFCPSPRLTKNKSRAVNDHRAIPFNSGDSQLPLNEGAERRRATKNGFWKSSSARNRSSRSVDTGMISIVTHTTHNYHFGSSLIADGGAGRTPGYVSHLVIRDLKVESKPSGSSLSECFLYQLIAAIFNRSTIVLFLPLYISAIDQRVNHIDPQIKYCTDSILIRTSKSSAKTLSSLPVH